MRKDTTKSLTQHVWEVIFHALEGVWEHLGRSLKKGSKKVLFEWLPSHCCDNFQQRGGKRRHHKMSIFWDPLLSAENRPQVFPEGA